MSDDKLGEDLESLEPQELIEVAKIEKRGTYSYVGPIIEREGCPVSSPYTVVNLSDLGRLGGGGWVSDRVRKELGELLWKRGVYSGPDLRIRRGSPVLDGGIQDRFVSHIDLVVSDVNARLQMIHQCSARLAIFSQSPGLIVFWVTDIPEDLDVEWSNALRAKVQRVFEKADLQVSGATRVVFMGSVLEEEAPPGDPEDFLSKELRERHEDPEEG